MKKFLNEVKQLQKIAGVESNTINEEYQHIRYLVNDLKNLYYSANDDAFKRAVVDVIPDSDQYTYLMDVPEKYIQKLENLKKMIPQARLSSPNSANKIIDDAIKFFMDKQEINESNLDFDDRVVVVYGNQFYGQTGTIVNRRGSFIEVEMDSDGGVYSMNVSDVRKIEDEEEDEYDDYMEENDINESAQLPDNVKAFAKRKGVLSLVNKVATWADKSGKRIRGGTAIGKNYDTLVLDLSYQDSAIYINIPDETVELYGEPVYDAKSFANVLASNEEDGIQEKKSPGLWANIRAKRERGEAPARKGSKEYKKAVKAAKEINKANKK